MLNAEAEKKQEKKAHRDAPPRGLDRTKRYGIVLEGGGARGSYQVGVWRALEEAGIAIDGIAGASVGALNGALMCQHDLKRAEKLWSSISYGKVLAGSTALLSALSQPKEELFGRSAELKQAIGETKQLIEQKGFDITPLKRLISENIDPAAIRRSDRELYAVTFSAEERREITVDIRALPEDSMCDMLLASAYLPGFRQEKLQGRTYIDGGMLNSVPVNVLLSRGYRNLIVVRIYGVGITRPVRIPRGAAVHEVAPCADIGGLLEFDRRQSVRNMRLGYFDGLRLLHGYYGKHYYFDCSAEEAQCYDLPRMEKVGEALSVDRFRIYRPDRFLRKLLSEDQKRVALGERSAFLEKPKRGILKRIFADKKKKEDYGD